jgi:hypothetical protein
MPGVVVHACNPSTWEAEAGKLPIGSQPELYSETLSPKQNKTKQKGVGCVRTVYKHLSSYPIVYWKWNLNVMMLCWYKCKLVKGHYLSKYKLTLQFQIREGCQQLPHSAQ